MVPMDRADATRTITRLEIDGHAMVLSAEHDVLDLMRRIEEAARGQPTSSRSIGSRRPSPRTRRRSSTGTAGSVSERRALIRAEGGHQDRVHPLAVPEERVALPSFVTESRLLIGPFGARIEGEHVEADAVHEQIVRHEVIDGLLEQEPGLAADVVFGIDATGYLDDRFGARLLADWRAGHSSLRTPRPATHRARGEISHIS